MFTCQQCGKDFETSIAMMTHKKKEHSYANYSNFATVTEVSPIQYTTIIPTLFLQKNSVIDIS